MPRAARPGNDNTLQPMGAEGCKAAEKGAAILFTSMPLSTLWLAEPYHMEIAEHSMETIELVNTQPLPLGI